MLRLPTAAASPYYTLTSADLPQKNSAAARPAPLKGFLTSPEWHSGGYENPAHLSDPESTLEFYYIGLSDVMDGMASFPGFDSVVEPRVTASASRGKHAILRFYMDYPKPEGSYVSHTPQFLKQAPYNVAMTPWISTDLNAVGSSPDYGDANLVMALTNFIAALGERYDGDPRVGYIQLGLLGFWGEWHTWTGDPATDTWIPDATRMAVIDAYDDAFQTTQVQARYIHWYAVGREGFGLHDDSFAHSTIDEGVYGGSMDWFFWSQVVNAGATDFWKLGAMGGELRPELQSTVFDDSYASGTQYKQDFGMCSETTHASYMLNYYAYWPGYAEAARPPEAIDEARATTDRMGYAFSIVEVSVAEGSAEGTVDITATVSQDGIAPYYYDLDITLSCPGHSASMPGVDDIIEEASTLPFTFTSVPATSSCLDAISFSLDSSYELQGTPIKFAQGTTDGATVDISLPLPSTGKPGVCSTSAANPGAPCASDTECNCSRRQLLTGHENVILRGRETTPKAHPDNRRLKGKPAPTSPAPTPSPQVPCTCEIPSSCLEANEATCTSASDCCSGLTCGGDGVCHELGTCFLAGAGCTSSDQCCSRSCKGKTGRKTCK